MPSVEKLDHYSMELDDDYLEILEEIPKSPTFNNRLKWKQNPVPKFGASNTFVIKLKQANQKITQQRDVILELQDKMKHQTGKLEDATKIIANQKKMLQNSQRGKLKLRKDLAVERQRGREILSKLVEFFKHINSEFAFTINTLKGKSVEDRNNDKCASIPATNIIGIENKLKQLSIGVANKLKKLKKMEAERETELENAKKIVSQIQARNSTTMNTKSTQTNMTSIGFNESFKNIPNKSSLPTPIIIEPNGPIRLRLKRARYEYQQQNDSKSSGTSETNGKVANFNDGIDNSKTFTTRMTALKSNYLDSDKRHEVDNRKHEENLFYCACGLTFSSTEWLNNHIKLFDTLWGSEKNAMKGNVCGKVNPKPVIQESVIVNNNQS